MSTSTKPYLIRALHEWCTDNGYTPYIVIWVDEQTNVPREFVKDNEIVLNIAHTATKNLHIDNDWLSFSARFGGVSREILAPVGNIMSIFARETGEGMGFEVEAPAPAALAPVGLRPVEDSVVENTTPEGDDSKPPRPSGKPSLRIVK
ncbi:ClpXP protease specificity-enhancing factor [Paludibacterium denitrificans]|uniref:ClpXP protease specificity-enhancing factor n=1 Tax=Paludibacterium denitrificans TaxID=2675226 RepID=A0A844GDS3_9NEIS|nr:ClpXP protease specificity-enhancing factor [Paludibacterium denitrificans]MTD33378.1 ClpXP protease specificity-enhancing factor [Paludibacterium denitrificans]HJV07605.1 ClpXP protease specificity-enhancing factor [Chromobacteriaceae bacterium]